MSRGLEGPRATLNELKWRYDALAEAILVFEDREAPDGEARASGADIVDLGRSFITLEREFGEVQLPYHRVQEIRRGDEVVFDRDEMGGEPGQHPEPG
jgi:uncharacterized protein (UPF0248 family)